MLNINDSLTCAQRKEVLILYGSQRMYFVNKNSSLAEAYSQTILLSFISLNLAITHRGNIYALLVQMLETYVARHLLQFLPSKFTHHRTDLKPPLLSVLNGQFQGSECASDRDSFTHTI